MDTSTINALILSAKAQGRHIEISETTTITIRIQSGSATTLDLNGFYSAHDIAVAFKVGEGVLRRRLGEKWRLANTTNWQELENQPGNEARFQFRISSVMTIIDDLLSKQAEDAVIRNQENGTTPTT
jgi:hypothetical protein